MSEQTPVQNQDESPIAEDAELNSEELEDVAGGSTNNGCSNWICADQANP